MLTGQAMSTMGKFVLLCCHFDSAFLKLFDASFFFAILLWHSGSLRDASGLAKGIVGLWEPGIWSLVGSSRAST